MNEYQYYKICIQKDDDYFEEQINFRVVYSTDTDIIKEENSKACIEYNLSSGQLSLECNFDNVDKYITNDEFIAIRNDSEVETSLLDMVYGAMTFSDHIGIRTYNTYGRIKTRENFLNEICDIINSHCRIKVSWKYITDDEDLNHQRSIDNAYSIRPWPQEGLESFLNIYTGGCIYTDYFFDYGQYEFEDLWEKYGDKIFKMFNHVHGPTCLMWDKNRNQCSYCGTDYDEIIEEGGYCAGIQEEILNLIEICLFCGPRALMYYGQKNKIDYKLINDVINEYAYFYENGKYENMVEKWNFTHEHNHIFKELNYNINESMSLYEKSLDELKRIIHNYEMFARWDKIRTRMGSDEIIIGYIPRSEYYKDDELKFITKIELSIIKHSEKEYPNYFWIGQFHDGEVNKTLPKGERTAYNDEWETVDASPDYKDITGCNVHIDWQNTELLENLEILYDIKPHKIKEV